MAYQIEMNISYLSRALGLTHNVKLHSDYQNYQHQRSMMSYSIDGCTLSRLPYRDSIPLHLPFHTKSLLSFLARPTLLNQGE